MSISVNKQGLLDTLQDMGRYGYQHLGINPCGAMDTLAAAVANILVGNEKNEAVIELHFPASSFLFHQQSLVALSGADFHAMVDGEPIPLNTPVLIGENCTLEFKQFRHGERCYLAVHRGFKIGQWLNSYSTHLKARAGGYAGRRFEKEDVLNLNNPLFDFSSYPQKGFFIFPSSVDVAEFYAHSPKIRCVEGAEYLWLTDDSKKTFLSYPFHLTTRSDRMGYCIEGKSLNMWNGKQLISSAVTKGTVQLLPSGQLIILMSDHQTTGGYPKIAHVISADIPKLAQMRPNRIIQFEMINLSQAEELFIEQQRYLQHLNEKINLALNQFFCDANYRPEL
jgi:antagonist of KipI